MPQKDIQQTYHGQQFRRENVQPNDINSVEFMTGDPANLSTNPKRIWVEQSSGSLRFTVDGVVIHDVTGASSSVINVKEHGAIGDGITDDTDAVQSALNLATIGTGPTELVIPPGDYRLSRRGQFLNNWQNAAYFADPDNKTPTYRNYALYLSGATHLKITMMLGARFIMDMSDAVKANFLVLQECTDVEINGWNCLGEGVQTRQLYNAAALHIDSCARVHVSGGKAVNCHHNTIMFLTRDSTIDKCYTQRTAVPFIWGGVNLDFPIPDPVLLTHMGTHIGLYASRNISVTRCVSYGSCEDGDIGILGGGSYDCTFSDNHMFNYFLEDETASEGVANDIRKKIVLTRGQGLFVDSGPVGCIVTNNRVEGYYYGVDIKTDLEGTLVKGNRAVRNMVGIAIRRGEANLPLASSTVVDNFINPNGGNGREIYAGFFDVDGRGYVEDCPVGIWVQDNQGTIIKGNTIANNYFIRASNNYVGVYVANTRLYNAVGPAYIGPTLISGNYFGNEQRQRNSAEAGSSERSMVVVAGWFGDPIDDPLTAPVLTQAAGGTTLTAGAYWVVYEWTNAAGDTLKSPQSTITITAGNKMIVTMPTLPANATGAKVFIGKAATPDTWFQQGTALTSVYEQTTAIDASGNTVAAANTTGYSPVTGVTIDANICDPKFTSNTDVYPNGYFWLEYVEGLNITNHQFSAQVQGYYPMKLKACKDVLFSGQTFQTVRGIMELNGCHNVRIIGNSSNQSTAGTTRPYYRFLDSTVITFQHNHVIKSTTSTAGYNDGPIFTVEGTTNYVNYSNNTLQLDDFNPNTVAGAGFTGTLDLTGTFPKNVVGPNTFIPTTQVWPASIGG